jgi:hypothetical protein
MTGPQRRFDPAELDVPGEPDPSAAERAVALAAARELENLAANAGIRPSEGFEDRVMAAIAAEPAPRLVAVPVSTVRGGRIGAFVMTVRRSWGVATSGGRPMAVRAQALAFVLLVILATGAMAGAGAVTVGALLGPDGATVAPDRDATPTPPSNTFVSPTSLQPTDSTGPEESTEPSDSPEPSETAEPGETAEPDEMAAPAGTPHGTRTPRPTETPESGETPEPHETPEPTETPEGTGGHGGDG